jgi:predicted permease
VLGVPPAFGRGFSADEDAAPVPVVVISHRLWLARFHEARDVLGRTLRVNGRDLTIVGVARVGFRGVALPADTDLWVPLPMVETLWPRAREFFKDRKQQTVAVYMRLAPSTSLEEARAALIVRAATLAEEYPATNKGTSAEVLPFQETRLSGRSGVTSYLGLVLGVVGFVLLIACANVSGLRLVDLSVREGEFATRRALGAGRWRLARLVLVESTLLYLLALAVSFFVAEGLLLSFRRVEVFSMSLAQLEPTVSLRVFAGAFLLTVIVGLLSSLAPVLQARKSVLPGRAAGLSAGVGRNRLWANLVVVLQVALSLSLLVGTGLIARTLWSVYGVDPGYQVENVLLVSVDLDDLQFRYDDDRARAFYREALERVRALPGVRNAAWSADVPFGRVISSPFVPEETQNAGEPDWIQVDSDIVTPGFLRTMGLQLLEGRDFTDRDDIGAPGVVMVNQTMARTYWPTSSAIGKRVRVFSRQSARQDVYEVVGIVRDAKYRNPWEEPRPYMYLPLAQRFLPNMNLHVRTEGPAMAMLPAVRDAIRALDDDLTLYNARPLSEQLAVLLARQRSVGLLFLLSALIALILSAVGTYGMAASVLASRRPELGLRMALGATAWDARRFVFDKGVKPLAAGLLLGLAASFALSRFVESLLIGVSARDTVAFAAGVAVMALSGIAASYVPALRASRIDPATALKSE